MSARLRAARAAVWMAVRSFRGRWQRLSGGCIRSVRRYRSTAWSRRTRRTGRSVWVSGWPT